MTKRKVFACMKNFLIRIPKLSSSPQLLSGLTFFCISEGQDAFLLGAQQAFFGWDLKLYDIFLPTNPGSKVCARD